MHSDDDDGQKLDSLYESLNPSKHSLLPLEYQAILKLKGDSVTSSVVKPTLSKINPIRPPSGDKRGSV